MNITNDIIYVGVSDRVTDLFEGQYTVSKGMAYNSYIILDEKIAVIDSVDACCGDKWIDNIQKALCGRCPDYLIVQHMEPDHSANITTFADKYPTAKIVASERAFTMMKNFFGTDYSDRKVMAGEGDTLCLGKHTLTFLTAPMVHWPEVLVTYDSFDKVLFSADAFGKFGATDANEEWLSEARRYYIGIVGKYGIQVQALLKRAAALDISTICPLHGPVLDDNIPYYIDLYDKWSSYVAEENGVAVVYSTVYGNTEKAAKLIYQKLIQSGEKAVLHNLNREDMSYAVADAFRFDRLIIATTTYCGGIFPAMKTFIDALIERGFQNRKIGLVENGSWGPVAAKKMKDLFATAKNIEFAEASVKIISAINDKNLTEIENLKNELLSSESGMSEASRDGGKFVCDLCGWTYNESEGAPEHGIAPGTKFEDFPESFVCPLCRVTKEMIKKV